MGKSRDARPASCLRSGGNVFAFRFVVFAFRFVVFAFHPPSANPHG
jgi:hypothetical protein